jgi:hypothetical protein
LSCHLDAPGAPTQIDRVQIQFQNFGLVAAFLQSRRHHHFAHFAFVGDIRAYQQVLHHLLRDGGAALQSTRIGQVGDESPHQPTIIDPRVLEESPVLGGDESVSHVNWNLFQGEPSTTLQKSIASGIQNNRHSGWLQFRQVNR